MEQANKFPRTIMILLCGGAMLILAGLLIDEITRREKAEDALALNIRQTTAVPTTNGQLVQQVQIDKATSAQLKAMSDSNFKLTKENKALIKEVSRLSITLQKVQLSGPILAGYIDTGTVAGNCDSLLQLAVITPKAFTYTSDSISLAGTVLKSGVRIDSLDIRDSLYTRDVAHKSGFLGLGRKQFTQIHHSNPLFSSDSAQVFVVDKSPSFYYRVVKPTIWGAAGIAIGALIINSIK